MLPPELPTLASLAASPSVHATSDFIADRTTALTIDSLMSSGEGASLARSLRGKNVLLALPGQLATIAALLALDGVARRIVLWPGDTLEGDVNAIMSAAAIDAVVTSWPMPDGTSQKTLSRPTALATEWVLFTSGTTGRPKMIVHTLDSLAGHLVPVAPGQTPPVWCSFYDIRRYGGMQIMLRALAAGGSLVLSDPAETPGDFLQRAAHAGATHFLGTPSHWRRALMARAQTIIAPRYVRLSGEVADQVVLDRLRVAFPDAAIVHAFASTEAGLAFEVTDGRAGFPDSLMGQGRLADVRLVDGALHVRSPRNASGVLDGTLRRMANDDGFVETGDHVDHRDGRYHVAGRSDGVVNVGGQKVHPEEVEAVLNQHPDVQMSLVSARANPITGAIVVAQVVTLPRAPGAHATRLEDELRAFCRVRLPPHKIPASFRLVPSLPVAPAESWCAPLRNVIVTGGTRGLGLGIATGLAAQGFRVIAIARTESDAFQASAARLNAAQPGCLHFHRYDLTDLDGIANLIPAITREHGPLYGLVNNAGIGSPGILATMPDKQIAALLHLNIASPIAVTKQAVRAMMVGGGGRIINMSSIVAATGYSGLSVYAATKAALTGFTRSLARELGPLGITVNCIAPGFIDTDMTTHMEPADKARIAGRSALKRLADPEDVAAAVQYLLSDQARNVTAVTLTVDAGNTA